MVKLLEEPVILTDEVYERLAKLGECVVLCYNTAEVWENRVDAAAFYAEGVRECEGCEAERYMNVLLDLLDRKRICHDGVTEMLMHPIEYR